MSTKIDLPFIQSAIILFVACIVFSIAAKYSSQWYLEHVQENKKKAEQVLATADQKLYALKESRESYDTYHKNFATLVDGGLFDQYGKVRWLDLLDEGRNKMQLPYLNYEIGAQKSFQASFLPAATEAGVVMSEVKLEAGLLHEDDLVSIFKWFDQNIPGVLHFSDCDLALKQAIKLEYDPKQNNLEAKCHLKWLIILPINRINTGAATGMEAGNGGMF